MIEGGHEVAGTDPAVRGILAAPVRRADYLASLNSTPAKSIELARGQ